MYINNTSDFYKACRAIRQAKRLAIDLETTGLDRFGSDKMCGVAIYDGTTAYYFPYRHGTGYNLPLYTLPLLIFSTKGKRWDMHNAPFDIANMVNDGWVFPGHCGELFETMIGVHLLNENEPTLQLKKLGEKYLNRPAEEEKELFNKLAAVGYKGKKAKGEMWRLDGSDVAPYAEMDVILTWELANFCTTHLLARDTANLPHVDYATQFGLWREWNTYQAQLTMMEIRGIMLDVKATEKASYNALRCMQDAENELLQHAPYTGFNVRSNPQLQAWFNSPTTDKEFLDSIHPTDQRYDNAQRLLNYRGWQRAYKNYYTKFLEVKDPQNVVHTNFNITGTVTPRISSREPNLQNLARDNDIFNVRSLLVARDGYYMLSSDLSKAELCIAAHFAREQKMIDALNNGDDLHQITADMLGVSRQLGKTCNFSLLYRIGAEAFMRKAKLSSIEEAEEVRQAFYAAYPGIDNLHYIAMEKAEKYKTIRWFSGRERHYNDRVRAPYRHAMANLVQGTVGDIIRVAINRMWAPLKELDCHVVLQVHDDVKVEVKQENLALAVPIIEHAMTDFPWLTCRMQVDVNYGSSLGDMQPYVRE